MSKIKRRISKDALLAEIRRLRAALTEIAEGSAYCGEDAGDMQATAEYALRENHFPDDYGQD